MDTVEMIIAAIGTWGMIILTVVQALGISDKAKQSKMKSIYDAFEAVVQISYNNKVRLQKAEKDDGKLTEEERKQNMEDTIRETRLFLESNYPKVLPVYDVLADEEKIVMVEKIIRDFKANK